MLLLAFALSIALGYLAITSVWPEHKPSRYGTMIRVSLAPGFGLGIFSLVFWLTLLSGNAQVVAVDVLLLILLGFTYSVQRSRAPNALPHQYDTPDVSVPKWLASILTASFA